MGWLDTPRCPTCQDASKKQWAPTLQVTGAQTFSDSIDSSRVHHRTMSSGYQRNPSPCLATWPMPGQAK